VLEDARDEVRLSEEFVNVKDGETAATTSQQNKYTSKFV
jgi:hypothetical protein